MSTIPVVRQIRRQLTLTGGSIAFEITSEIIDRGDLPFTHLFVVNLGADRDPRTDVLARIATPIDLRQADASSPVYVRVDAATLILIGLDTFARIANVNDVTQLPRDRVVAQRRGLTQYLTSSIALVYDNLTAADAAARQVRDRVSALVTEWRSFNSTFATNPYQDYDLPSPSASVESARTAVYVTQKNARIAAEAERESALLAKEACERDCAADKVIYDFLVYDVAFLDQAANIVEGQTNDTYVGAGAIIAPTPLTPSGPFTVTVPSSRTRDFVRNGASIASYAALLLKKRADLAVYAARVQACATTCARLSAALLAAQQIVDAALVAERAALASVRAVCPTFDPSTV
jgi:hypothetical protein